VGWRKFNLRAVSDGFLCRRAREKGGPWPFILWMDPHDAEKATLFGSLFFEGKGRRETGGGWFVNVSNVAQGRAEIQAQ
jgi:hypothetical protein